MVETASLMAPNAFATKGTLISTSAVRSVATRPMAACRIETTRRFSPKAQAIASNATTPNADCNCNIGPRSPEPIMAAGDLQVQCRSQQCAGIDKRFGLGHAVTNNKEVELRDGSHFGKQEPGSNHVFHDAAGRRRAAQA